MLLSQLVIITAEFISQLSLIETDNNIEAAMVSAIKEVKQ